MIRRLAPRDEAGQPRAIGVGQGFAGLVPVALVGANAAHDDVVLENRGRRDVRCGTPVGRATTPDAGETHDAAGPDGLDRIDNQLSDARALDDDVRLEADATDRTGPSL